MSTDLTSDKIWLVEWRTELVEELGGYDKWPMVIVEKWEYNRIGERRFIESVTYNPPKNKDL